MPDHSFSEEIVPNIQSKPQLEATSSRPLHGVVVTQVQDPARGLGEPHRADLGPWIQPVQTPVQSLPALRQADTAALIRVICKLAEGALDLLTQIMDKDTKPDRPQSRAPGNTARDRPPAGFNSIPYNSLGSAISQFSTQRSVRPPTPPAAGFCRRMPRGTVPEASLQPRQRTSTAFPSPSCPSPAPALLPPCPGCPRHLSPLSPQAPRPLPPWPRPSPVATDRHLWLC